MEIATRGNRNERQAIQPPELRDSEETTVENIMIAYAVDENEQKYELRFENMPTIKVNDINLYYEIHGEGETLINIQGWGVEITSAEFGAPQIIEELAKHYRVIAFDNRGVGRTDKPDIPYSIEMMAEDAIGLMKSLGIERAHIVGGSLGGCVAQMIAARHPERVNGLVLHGAWTRMPLSTRIMTKVLLSLPGSKRRETKRAKMLFQQKYPPTPESFFRQLYAGLYFDSRKLLGRINAPTLIVNCKKDQFMPMKITRELAEGIPGAKLVLLERDHLFIMKEPELVARPALEFLLEVDAGSDKEAVRPKTT